MEKIQNDQLDEIFKCHQMWLIDNSKGVRARVREADLSNLDLKNYNLKRAIFLGVNFSNSDLSNADLSGADLRGCNLTNANLTGANLEYADLRNTNLTDVKFYDADLTMAALNDANMSNAVFYGSILKNATLYGAKLQNAKLNGIVSTENLRGFSVLSIQIPESHVSHHVSITYWRELNVITTESFQGTMAEFQKNIEKESGGNRSLESSYQRAIDFIQIEMKYDLLLPVLHLL